MRFPTKAFVVLAVLVLAYACRPKGEYKLAEKGFQGFVDRLVGQLSPLENERNLAEWNAYITGKEEFFKASDSFSLKVDALYQNKEDFAYLKNLREKSIIKNELLKRQLDVLYLDFLRNQGDPELNKKITELTSTLSQKLFNFRAEYAGKKYTDNEITEVLKKETDLKKREELWKSQKKVGALIAGDLEQLVALRNQMARELGFDNFYVMALTLGEQDPKEVESIFNELAQLTDEPFKEVNSWIQGIFAKRFGITREEIRPWHYEDLFAQEVPAVFDIDLDTYYKNTDIPALVRKYYASFGMDVDPILAKSDLFEKEGKTQHAFSFCLDRGQDIRVLLNIVPNLRWMDTMLHELGHSVYDKYIDMSLPYLLRQPAHAFTTEGTAILFGSMASSPQWMKQALGLSPEEMEKIAEVVVKNSRLSKMVFARWSLVMKFFEQEMYAHPDQDLNKLWWDLVERYQYIKRPRELNGGEWATKIHLGSYPAYYHNYLLGELFAAQVRHAVMAKESSASDAASVTFWNDLAAGDFIKANIFAPGDRWPWSELMLKATDEPLTAKYFVEAYL